MPLSSLTGRSSVSTQRLLARIGRWPRRIAALICLLLAAGSALLPHAPAAPAEKRSGRLQPNQVAVPVTVRSAGEARPGVRVGVVAPPVNGSSDAVLVADRLRVVSVAAASGLDGTDTVVEVVTDRAHALELARYTTRPLLLIVDALP